MNQEGHSVFEKNGSSMHFIAIRKDFHASKEDMGVSIKNGEWHIPHEELEFRERPFRMLYSFSGRTKFAIANHEALAGADTKAYLKAIGHIVRKAVPEFRHFRFDRYMAEWGREDEETAEEDLGYIGYQSRFLLRDFLKKKGISLKEFILDDRYMVIIDGDEYDDFYRYLTAGIIDGENIREVFPERKQGGK